MSRLFFIAPAVALIAACASPTPIVEVPPPIVVTVVVTPTGGEPAVFNPGATQSPSSYPAPFQANITAVYQPFERGFMVFMSDRRAIWVFAQPYLLANTADPAQAIAPNFGTWFGFDDTFVEGEPEVDAAILAPEGFLQPKRGFGKVWREQTTVREALGWATQFEQAYAAVATDYSIGKFDSIGNYTPQSFIHTVTLLDGSVVHIDQAAGVWSRP